MAVIKVGILANLLLCWSRVDQAAYMNPDSATISLNSVRARYQRGVSQFAVSLSMLHGATPTPDSK